MYTLNWLIGRKALRPATVGVVAMLVLVSTNAVEASSEELRCFSVRGEFDENAVGPQECNSPVNFCFEGEYSGGINGTFFGSVISLVSTVDPETSNVLLFNSESEIQARVRGRVGTLIIRNSGAFETDGEGNIVDLQSIIGGTGELNGASGTIRASGLFDPDTASGSSRYKGTVCIPKN